MRYIYSIPRLLGILSLSLFLSLYIAFGSAAQSYAQMIFNFGGIEVSVICPCSETWLVVVGPPKPGEFVYMDTPQFSYYRLTIPGAETLGTYIPGPGVCLFPGPPYACATPISIPNEGIIELVGTSGLS